VAAWFTDSVLRREESGLCACSASDHNLQTPDTFVGSPHRGLPRLRVAGARNTQAS